MDGITTTKLEDTGVFIVTTFENGRYYPLDFYPVSVAVMERFDLKLIIE